MYFYESKALPKISMLDAQRSEYVECFLVWSIDPLHLESSLVDASAIATSRCVSGSRVGRSTRRKGLVFSIINPGVSNKSISDSLADIWRIENGEFDGDG